MRDDVDQRTNEPASQPTGDDSRAHGESREERIVRPRHLRGRHTSADESAPKHAGADPWPDAATFGLRKVQ